MLFRPEPYQVGMTDHLFDNERGALFCGIGLGKTAATLNAVNNLYLDGATKGVLVIAPLRVARLTWPNEIEKWDQFRWMRKEILIGQKPSGKANIYLTNYDRIEDLADLDFCDTVVLDELTKMKNPASIRAKHLSSMFRKHRRWGLTGTPRPNSLLELFAQIKILDDGKRLGVSMDRFKRCYFENYDRHGYNWSTRDGSEEKIYQRINDLVLVRRSSDYLDIADIETEDIEVDLPIDAHGMYKELERELMAYFFEHEIVAQNSGILVNKLLQITGGTVYTQKEGEERQAVKVHHAKIHALRKLVLEIGKEEPILIATNFIHERERVVEAVGGVDASKFKGDIEDAWNSGAIKRLVADPRSLGHGLNLQAGGRNIIWFSPNYSRELYDQFNGRLARKGQTGQVKVYHLICPRTIDDVVMETLRVRGDEQAQMLSILTNYARMGLCFK